VTLTLPPELADLLARAGGRWPQADEDQLHTLAGSWRSFGDELSGLKESGRAVSWQVTGGVGAMAKAVLATKQTIAEAAAATYEQILKLRRLANMSGSWVCLLGRAIIWLLSKFGKYILQASSGWPGGSGGSSAGCSRRPGS
jgi:hypothetical protein